MHPRNLGALGMDHRSSIIANPDGAAWDFTKRVFEYLQRKEQEDQEKDKQEFIEKVGKRLDSQFHGDSLKEKQIFAEILYDCMCDGKRSLLDLNALKIIRHPDGEPKPKIIENIRGAKCCFIHDSSLDSAEWFTQLDFVNDAMRNSSAEKIINVIPYYKFGRQERKDESRTCNSASRVAQLMDYPSSRVVTIDVHNDATQGFFRYAPFDNLPSFPTVIKHLRQKYPEFLENLVILGPDEGSLKRIRKYAKALGIGIAFVDKYRKISGELGESQGILGDVTGKNVLQVDDMYSTGGTSIQGALAARNHGAKQVWLYATHGLFTKGYEELAACCDRLLVGDTIPQRPEFFTYKHFEVVSFDELIGEVVYRINKGRSVSDLYQLSV